MWVNYMGRAYITLQGCNDKDEALKIINELATWLENMASNGIILSYLARPLYDSDETILDALLEPEEVRLFTNNQFPVVYCTIAIGKPINDLKQGKISDFEERFALKTFRAWTGEAISKKD